jgi:hypothetical protein
MPARRELTMRQLRQMLRLADEGVSARAIGRMLGAARSTVQDNLKRAEAAGLAWPLGAEITDAALSSSACSRGPACGPACAGGSNRTGARWHARPSGQASI